jgi:hypothetical protein
MTLRLTKLESVRRVDDKTIARCPACAASGHDDRGEHLVIYPDGRFGCAAHQGDAEHRRLIWRLAGDETDSKAPVRTVRGTGWRGSKPISRTLRTPFNPHPNRA